MKNPIDFQKLYDETFNEFYEHYVSEIETLFRKNDGIAKNNKLQDYKNLLINKRNEYTQVQITDSSYNTDSYIIKLAEEFERRETDFDFDFIENFFEHSFLKIKSLYKDRQNEIAKPEIYKLNAEKTLMFLAEYLALKTFLNDVSSLYISKTDTVEGIIERITLGKNVDPLEATPEPKKGATTSQQVLAFHYIFEALQIEETRALSSKKRFIRMLISKNLDGIKKDLKEPFNRKSLKEQKKDLEFVQKFFVDLGHKGIINKIHEDVMSVVSKNE